MIAQPRTPLDLEEFYRLLDECYLGENTAVLDDNAAGEVGE